MEPQVAWMAPSPIWSKLAQDPQSPKLQRPMILRFASDTFIEDLQAQLAAAPADLDDLEARRESFRARPAGTKPEEWNPTTPEGDALKLYQPAHGHFYLVTCSLICRMAGMPDRTVDSAQRERVSFVVRRLRQASKNGPQVEYALIGGAPTAEETAAPVAANGLGPRQVMAQRAVLVQRALDAAKAAENGTVPTQPGWVKLTAEQQRTVLPGEERLPFFPVRFVQNGQTRRLLAGYIPVAARETYETASVSEPAESEPSPFEPYDPTLELKERVLDPLVDLDNERINDEQAETVSLFLLLDLVDFLMLYLPNLHQHVVQEGTPDLTGGEDALLESLNGWTVNGSTSWRAALETVWVQKDRINNTGSGLGIEYDLRDSTVPPLDDDPNPPPLPTIHDELRDEMATALQENPGAVTPDPLPPAPKNESALGDQYVIRAVYERPHCRRTPVTVSERTDPFHFAPFFDFDAPMRPVTITMPDTSLENLRKFGRNVSVVMSKKLSEQIQQATGVKIRDLEDGNIGESDGALAMICTFSIPIITICALILLMIIVQLLNIVFWWLPLFKICIPIPRVE